MGEHQYRYGRMFSASGAWGVFCAVSGFCAAACGVVALLRAAAPDVVPSLAAVDSTVIYVIAGVFSVLTAVLVVIARVRARSRNRYTRSTRWGILAIALAVMLTGLSAAIDTMFSDGLISAPVRDEAPISDSVAMEEAIDSTADGGCVDGWQSISSTGYPGVTSIRMCAPSLIAYATFDNNSALPMYKAPLESQASSMLAERSELTDIQWATLSGARWIVVGQKESLEPLQRQWGGELSELSAADDGSK